MSDAQTGELSGKVAIVTGSASGIGQGIALGFLRAGARVIAADLNANVETRNLAARERLEGQLHEVRADVTQEDDIARIIEAAQERYGRLDIMVNNAGGSGALEPILDIDAKGFDLTFALLVRSVFLGIRHAGRFLKAQGEGGVILTTGSIAARAGGCSPSLYAAAKAAVVQLSAMSAVELAPYSIRVNTVSPGPIMIPGFASSGISAEQLIALQPWPEAGQPSDVAAAMTFLASEKCRFATGSDWVLDGGILAQGPLWLERLYGKST
ncbi:SDR family oxidoreductase [Sphingobium sp. WCS2017Hpa-17]|uniref:SDR family NAD(P)-dependent oxidoreductase n=1 Tax=Sphingobium sp. WCS2017Hpa-17 TaxID=3073638 RepID=UPI002889D3E2|nr:SDR family oxidoreductase [Sphingobium sp. WCS2017Hpa-17]